MSTIANNAGKQIRAALKQNFGSINFQVRRYDRARVSRYVISWIDGPSEDDVLSLALPHIRGVSFGSIYCVRDESDDVA